MRELFTKKRNLHIVVAITFSGKEGTFPAYKQPSIYSGLHNKVEYSCPRQKEAVQHRPISLAHISIVI
jgi:hypothetical protein